ncbi:M28 family metallopeptidase [uncultured Paraglaciecola sp.]|uniref:M28 family metallopeptidase n=1 Tax=uncultured Paraglaciecola sp. TaxID=1765024 RepID=UPI002598CA51|nr:M28 family metallopeptidase [uncultured Paraglaciecola sp.]
MKLKKVLSSAFCLLFICGCSHDDGNKQATNTKAEISLINADKNRIRSHLTFLADDLLKGRDTGSVGHEIASLYIASEFEKYGLMPAGDNDSYMQRVPFVQSTLDQNSIHLSLSSVTNTHNLSYPKEFLTRASVLNENTEMAGKLIFVGYGIIAPELDHNDYAGLDVAGKVVVVLSGKPKSFPSEEGAHFGSTREKQRHAAENGAVGYITISTPRGEKVRPYQNLLNYIHTPSVSWLDEDGMAANVYPELKGSAYFSKEAAELLFVGTEKSLEDIYVMLEQDQSPKGFDIPLTVNMTAESQHKIISSPNVVAILEGSDPLLKKEYVVYSAHSDHIGIAKTVKKDKINNGAMDNATGTSVLLETARLFSELADKPKRSILFVAVTAEEKGLIGSDYFAQNPTVPQSSLVANVNLDMPILTYEFADVIAFGANHSDMQESVTIAAEKIGLTLSPDPWPDQALFTRSDHYSFVKQGIPSVFLVPGLKSVDPEVDGSKQFNLFLKTNYHKPGDDLNQTFNWQAATKFAEVNFYIGMTLANQPQRSSWNEGDFFGDNFSK